MLENINELTATVYYADNSIKDETARVISEHSLSISVNEHPAYMLICTKNDLKGLVVGRLLTDGLITSADDIDRIIFRKGENEASVFLKKEMQWEDNGSKKTLNKLPECDWKSEWIFALVDEFKKGAKLHDATGGTHICILARKGVTLYVSEDIGRHNALDKAIGHAMLGGIDLSECMIFSSGRLPVDMVEKVISAGIPVLVSKSVATKEATELAREYGLNLICRAWPDRFEAFNAARPHVVI